PVVWRPAPVRANAGPARQAGAAAGKRGSIRRGDGFLLTVHPRGQTAAHAGRRGAGGYEGDHGVVRIGAERQGCEGVIDVPNATAGWPTPSGVGARLEKSNRAPTAKAAGHPTSVLACPW